ncbi:hypothetical protein FOL47_002894 [Perkinsus chesapeaki]|uniref:Uncharacterized protein n=1 Tax=Perkinsus chesapeaki TaxID=330153 RepID=A0A7J6MAZ6_PERCH|nr:hypothetical protein FOL47_002894 [Perkinsus chesapeaki]
MARLFTLLAFTTCTVMLKGIKSLQTTPHPSGTYWGDIGALEFNASNPTFAMSIRVLECAIEAQGLQYGVGKFDKYDQMYPVYVNYEGTDLEHWVHLCGNPRIHLADFGLMWFYFNPSNNENAIELKSLRGEWDGLFKYAD